jgi:CheY-like chemotaxis protein
MAREAPSPLVIGFVADLIFQVKIEEAAARSNFQVRWIERTIQVMAQELSAVQFSEEEALIEQLSTCQPGLLIFDLGNPEIPWRAWVGVIKSTPATRRIPLICYGSHKDAESLQAAKKSGADLVLVRSKFAADVAGLIQKHGRVPPYAELESACQEPLSEIARHGIDLFNAREYFEAHEYLEEAWNEDHTPGKEFYRAILQVAVAYLQIERGNYDGAVKMFWRLRQWIDPLPDVCRGVNLAKLRDDARHVYRTLTELGRERIMEFDRGLFKPVEYR